MPHGEPHETLAPGVLLSSGNLFQTKHVSIKTANGIDVVAAYILVDMVVSDNSLSHAGILSYRRK